MEWISENIKLVAAIVTAIVYVISRIYTINKVYKAALLLLASQIESKGGDTAALRAAIALEADDAEGSVKELIEAVAEKVDEKKTEHKGVRFLKFLLKIAVPFRK